MKNGEQIQTRANGQKKERIDASEEPMTSNHNPGLTSKKPKISEGQLEPLFRRLNLAHTRRIYQDVADKAEKESWSYRDFLALLLAEEVAHRKTLYAQRSLSLLQDD